ncbi:MAG: hypothetical protein MRY21_06745 [Simkaniaceae bacterium]|nr:hypothetical protein [Simkaniaceae bacterium]
MAGGNNIKNSEFHFIKLLSAYSRVQCRVMRRIASLASRMSTASPGQFLLLQFQMSQVTQVGDSISNLISQVNSMLMTTVRNQKSS